MVQCQALNKNILLLLLSTSISKSISIYRDSRVCVGHSWAYGENKLVPEWTGYSKVLKAQVVLANG